MTGFRQLSWIVVVVMTSVLPACGSGGSGNGTNGTPDGAGSASISVQRVFSSLPSFSQPVGMFQAPGDDTRWFVVEQGGRVLVFPNNPAVSTATEFVNITARVASGGETGLLGMAFHPGFPGDPRVYHL